MDRFEYVIVNEKEWWADGTGHSIQEWMKILSEKNVNVKTIKGLNRRD